MPTPIGSPWPSEPVATSTQGSVRVGVALQPAAELAQAQQFLVGDGASRLYTWRRAAGQAWPLLKISRSLFGVVRVDSRSAGTCAAARPSGRRPTCRGGVARARRGGAADAVDAQLRRQLVPLLGRGPGWCLGRHFTAPFHARLTAVSGSLTLIMSYPLGVLRATCHATNHRPTDARTPDIKRRRIGCALTWEADMAQQSRNPLVELQGDSTERRARLHPPQYAQLGRRSEPGGSRTMACAE